MIKFLSAGPGDPELITVKGMRALQEADVVLCTGSLISKKELLSWCRDECTIENSAYMNYDELHQFIKMFHTKRFVYLHTGDSSLFLTTTNLIDFLEESDIEFEIITEVS